MSEQIKSYPLQWPAGWKRASSPKRAKFADYTLDRAVRFVLHELSLMGFPSWHIIISTNLRLRQDGLPYSNQAQPTDKGVSVWWRKQGATNFNVIALDQYNKVEHNIYAIGKTIEAMRGIKRWGSGEVLERTFTGFQALPPPARWQDILNVGNQYTLEECERNYRILRKDAHPDHGGSAEQFNAIQRAIELARQEFGTRAQA